MRVSEYKNLDGVDCIMVVYPDGSSWSGLKTAYEAMVAEGNTAEEWSPEA